MASKGQEAVEAVLGGMTSKLTAVSDLFERLQAPFAKFVDALSPGTMQVFNLAMRDLNATIGHAFLPVMQVLTDVVKKTAALLVPAVDALQPAFQKLADSLSSFILPSMQSVAHLLVRMAPFIDGIAQALQVLGDGFGVMTVIITSVTDSLSTWIKSLIGGGDSGGLKSVFDKIKTAFYGFLSQLILVTASIAKLLGNTAFIDSLKKNLQELANPKEGGKGAALQSVSTKGFEQISKDIAIAAAQAVASGGADDKPKELNALVNDVLNKLDVISNDSGAAFQVLKDLWADVRFWAAKIYEPIDDISDWTVGLLDGIKAAFKF